MISLVLLSYLTIYLPQHTLSLQIVRNILSEHIHQHYTQVLEQQDDYWP